MEQWHPKAMRISDLEVDRWSRMRKVSYHTSCLRNRLHQHLGNRLWWFTHINSNGVVA
jgi:hypothetical protein